jgi:hypothetical protein
MCKKSVIVLFMLIISSTSHGGEGESKYLSLDKHFFKINTLGVNFNLIEELYYEQEVEESSIYFMTSFFDSIIDDRIKSKLIESRVKSGELDCRLNLLFRSNNLDPDFSGTVGVLDTLDEVTTGLAQCGLLTDSEKVFILSRVWLNALLYKNIRALAWERLTELSDRNNIGTYSLMARAAYYYAMSVGGMRICLANNFGNCTVHEKWNPNLLNITDELRDSNNYYLNNLYLRFVITTAFYNADEFGVSNPYID